MAFSQRCAIGNVGNLSHRSNFRWIAEECGIKKTNILFEEMRSFDIVLELSYQQYTSFRQEKAVSLTVLSFPFSGWY